MQEPIPDFSLLQKFREELPIHKKFGCVRIVYSIQGIFKTKYQNSRQFGSLLLCLHTYNLSHLRPSLANNMHEHEQIILISFCNNLDNHDQLLFFSQIKLCCHYWSDRSECTALHGFLQNNIQDPICQDPDFGNFDLKVTLQTPAP